MKDATELLGAAYSAAHKHGMSWVIIRKTIDAFRGDNGKIPEGSITEIKRALRRQYKTKNLRKGR